MTDFQPIDCPNGATTCLVKRPGARCHDLNNADVPECAMTHVVQDVSWHVAVLKDAPAVCGTCGQAFLAFKDIQAHEHATCAGCASMEGSP